MKTLHVFLLAYAVFLPLAAQDRPDSAVESKIVAMEKAWNQAFKFRDTKALNELLDNGIVIVNDDGSLQSKSAFMDWIRKAKPADDEQVTPESLAVKVYGNVAVATGVFRTSGTEAGKAYSRRDRFADTWLKKSDNWVCVSATATPVLH
jgi:ketosteroid isomerase-like protein